MLTDVAGRWAVGSSGTILSWDGTSWNADDSGIGNSLFGVSCPTASLCKAVGLNDTILSWDGTSWKKDQLAASAHLYGVSCATQTLCKAVGDLGKILMGPSGASAESAKWTAPCAASAVRRQRSARRWGTAERSTA